MVSNTIPRLLGGSLKERLGLFPAVILLGPRQVGKTTLARAFAEPDDVREWRPVRKGLYLDLENPVDQEKLADARGYLATKRDRFVVLDEIHRAPHLFQTLRGVIDERIRGGEPAGQFLLLGSASMDLLRQSGESLAGRIAYLELGPLDIRELAERDQMRLWIRGGFPRGFLAPTDADSAVWRESFIRTYLERDIPSLGPRVPADTLRRFWTMLAHSQGGLWNAAALAGSLAVDGKTVARYVDLFVDLLLVRRLPPFHANVRKRLAKSPKVYVRDSGIVHTLLRLDDTEGVLGHPIAGASWEGFVFGNTADSVQRLAGIRPGYLQQPSVGSSFDPHPELRPCPFVLACIELGGNRDNRIRLTPHLCYPLPRLACVVWIIHWAGYRVFVALQATSTAIFPWCSPVVLPFTAMQGSTVHARKSSR